MARKRAGYVEQRKFQFIEDCVALEAEGARESGALGYMARVLVQATLPHSAKTGNEYVRSNGRLQVSILAPAAVGLPYGSYPRLLLAWMTTEAVRTRSARLYLGESLTEFMGKLGLLPTGGRWGTIPRLKDQVARLFSSYVTAYELDQTEPATHARGSNLLVAEDWELWWDPKPEQEQARFESWVDLSRKFYAQVTDRPVPIDLRALALLKRSPLALDLYAWATYRTSYLNRRVEIPWAALQTQFGADYATQGQGPRDFKKKALAALRKVMAVYPALRASEGEKGLVLAPSPPHVRRRAARDPLAH